MFRKLKSSFTGGSKGNAKVLFNVRVVSIAGVEPGASCRVVWARQSKVQITRPALTAPNGVAQWNEDLSLVSSMERDGKGGFLPKEFVFKVQREDRGGKFSTLGKLDLDLSSCVGSGSGKPIPREVRIPLNARSGVGRSVAALSIVVAATLVKKGGADSDSEEELDDEDLASEGSDISSVHEFPTPRPSSPVRAATAHPTAVLPTDVGGKEQTPSKIELPSVSLSSSDPGQAALVAETELAPPVQIQPQSAASEPGAIDDIIKEQSIVSGVVPAVSNPSSQSAEVKQLRADLIAAQEELATARSATKEAEARALRAEADASTAASRTETATAQVVKYEARISQLLAALESKGEGKGELEERLLAAETELGEAEALANEAMSLLEASQTETAGLREALEQAKHDAGFAADQAIRERSGWESRLKEAFRRVEGAVALAERAAEDRDDLAARLEAAQQQLQETNSKMGEHGAVAVGAAASTVSVVASSTVKATNNGSIPPEALAELESARHRLKGLEEAVERADALRAEAEAALQRERAEKAGLIDAGSRSAPNSEAELDTRPSSDETIDALRLELQLAQQESGRLRGEVESAARELQAASDLYGDETRVLRSRCAELGAQLHEARTALADAEARARVAAAAAAIGGVAAGGVVSGALPTSTPSRAATSTSPVSSSPLAAVNTSPLAAAAAKSAGSGIERSATSSPSQQPQPAVLEVLNGELTSLSVAMAGLTSERDTLESRLRDVETEFAAQQAALTLAQERVAAREAQLAALERSQRSLIAAGGAQNGTFGTHDESEQQLGDELQAARELAAFSSAELASTITSLAEAQADRADLAGKLTDLRDEVGLLRRGNEGELRGRLEALERDLLAARNRADVNDLFREEHDRLAADLVQTKLVWAEGQETLVKLRRQLVKSQEKSMSFASKLTRLETKLYARVKSTMKDLKQKATPRDRQA